MFQFDGIRTTQWNVKNLSGPIGALTASSSSEYLYRDAPMLSKFVIALHSTEAENKTQVSLR